MEIGPISGIRPVAMAKPADRSADLGKVFAAELRDQGRDAEEAESQKASRGLEEEDAENGATEEVERTEAGSASEGTISFFA